MELGEGTAGSFVHQSEPHEPKEGGDAEKPTEGKEEHHEKTEEKDNASQEEHHSISDTFYSFLGYGHAKPKPAAQQPQPKPQPQSQPKQQPQPKQPPAGGSAVKPGPGVDKNAFRASLEAKLANPAGGLLRGLMPIHAATEGQGNLSFFLPCVCALPFSRSYINSRIRENGRKGKRA